MTVRVSFFYIKLDFDIFIESSVCGMINETIAFYVDKDCIKNKKTKHCTNKAMNQEYKVTGHVLE